MTKEEFYRYLAERLYQAINPASTVSFAASSQAVQQRYINAAKISYNVVDARVSIYGDSSIDWDGRD